MDDYQHILDSADGMNAFFREVSQIPGLSAQEEKALALRCREDPQASRELVYHNLNLVVSVARSFAGRSVPMTDLIQEGVIGLAQAVQKYEPERDFRFSTYAVHWIRSSIIGCLRRQGSPLVISSHTAELLRKVNAAQEELRRTGGDDRSVSELAALTGLPAKKILSLQLFLLDMLSLEQTEEDAPALEQAIPASQAADPQELLAQAQLPELIGDLLSQLDSRQQTVLRLHYGIGQDQCHSLDEIARSLGISKERVRQVEKQAIAKLRILGTKLGLEDFLEE